MPPPSRRRSATESSAVLSGGPKVRAEVRAKVPLKVWVKVRPEVRLKGQIIQDAALGRADTNIDRAIERINAWCAEHPEYTRADVIATGEALHRAGAA